MFTCSIPIDSAGEVKNYWNFKNVPNLIVGEQPRNFHKNYPISNFLTVQPITTNNIPMIQSDAAQQAEDHENIKRLKILFKGSNRGSFRKIYPLNNLLTVQLISTNNIPIDSAQQVDEDVSLKICQISFLGSNPRVFEKFHT
jgi:hypothetical protein